MLDEEDNLALFARDDVSKFGPVMKYVDSADDTYSELVSKVRWRRVVPTSATSFHSCLQRGQERRLCQWDFKPKIQGEIAGHL